MDSTSRPHSLVVVGCVVVCFAVLLCVSLLRWRPWTGHARWLTPIGGGNSADPTIFDTLYNGPPGSKFYNVFVNVVGTTTYSKHYYYNREFLVTNPQTGASIETVSTRRLVFDTYKWPKTGIIRCELSTNQWAPKPYAVRVLDSLYAAILSMATDDFVTKPGLDWFGHKWVKFNLALVARNVTELDGSVWNNPRPRSDTMPLRLSAPSAAVVPLSAQKYNVYRVYVQDATRNDQNAVGYFVSPLQPGNQPPKPEGSYAAYYASAPDATKPLYFLSAGSYMCVLACLKAFKINDVFASSNATTEPLPGAGGPAAAEPKQLMVGSAIQAYYKLGVGALQGQLLFASSKTDEYLRFAQCTNNLQTSILYHSVASITALVRSASLSMDERAAWMRLLSTACTPTTPGMWTRSSIKLPTNALNDRKVDGTLYSVRTVSNVIVEKSSKSSSGPWVFVTYDAAMLDVASNIVSASSSAVTRVAVLRKSLSLLNIVLSGDARTASRTVQCFVGRDGKLYNADPREAQPVDMGVTLADLSATNLLSSVIIA